MVLTTRGLVLSALKYGEADLIVSCYTEAAGLKSYLLRGVRKSRKGKLRSSLFQPLTLLEMEVFHKDKGTLERIKEAKVLSLYQSLHTDVVKSAMVLFLAEMLKNSIQEQQPDPQLFAYLEGALIWLDNNDQIANFHIHFLLRLTAYLGFYPDESSASFPYFNLLEGSFQNSRYGDYCEEGETVEHFKMFFGIDFDESKRIILTKNQRLAALNLLLLYYQLHLQGYKKPKSLLVLNQLFS